MRAQVFEVFFLLLPIPWTASRPSQTVVGRLFLIFLDFFIFSLHSTVALSFHAHTRALTFIHHRNHVVCSETAKVLFAAMLLSGGGVGGRNPLFSGGALKSSSSFLQYSIVFVIIILFVLAGNYESIMKTKMNGKGPRNALIENSFTGGDESVTVHSSSSSSSLAKEEEIFSDADDSEVAEEGSAEEEDKEEEGIDEVSSSININSNDGGDSDSSIDGSNENDNNKQMSAIAIGNGASLRNSQFGRQVDANDVVLRFNLFKTVGFESDVGTKTTHWVMSTIKDPNDFDDEEVPNLKKSLQHVYIPFVFRDCKPQQYRCPRRKDKISKQNANMHKTETIAKKWLARHGMSDVKVHAVVAPQVETLYDEYNLKEKFPSMGLMFLNYAWRKFKQPVQFAGFDFYSGSHDHYWEKKLKNETCHNMNDESRVLSEFVKENKLKALDQKAHEVLMNYKSPTDAAYDPRCKIVCNTDVSNLFCLTLRGHEVDTYNKAPELWETRHRIHSSKYGGKSPSNGKKGKKGL